MAKNIVTPARSSVKNLVPFLSLLCPEYSNWKYFPTTDRATRSFIFSTQFVMFVYKNSQHMSKFILLKEKKHFFSLLMSAL